MLNFNQLYSRSESLPFVPFDGRLKLLLENRVKAIQFYEKHLSSYEKNLFRGGYNRLVQRLVEILDISFVNKLGGGFITFITGLAGPWSNNALGLLGKSIGGWFLNIDDKKLEKALVPLTVQVKAPKSFRMNISYVTKGATGSKNKVNFTGKKEDGLQVFEFQLFLPRTTHDSTTANQPGQSHKNSLYAHSSLPYDKVDPHFYQLPPNDNYVAELHISNMLNSTMDRILYNVKLHELVNRNTTSIFYNLKYLDRHINPMLIIHVHDKDSTPDVYFEERTKSYG